MENTKTTPELLRDARLEEIQYFPTTVPAAVEAIRDGVKAANQADWEYMRRNFNLGHAGTHCRRYSEFAPLITRAAAIAGHLIMDMPSEYHEPHYVEVPERPLDGLDLAQLTAEALKLVERQFAVDVITHEQGVKAAAYLADREAKAIRVGRRVRVARGRKVPHGTEGVVERLGNSYREQSAQLRTDDGRLVWTASKNLDVVAEAAAHA